jgi:hypothetical protein
LCFTSWFDIVLPGHAVMPNVAIPSPLVGTDDKEQVLNIGKHPSLVKVDIKRITLLQLFN